MISIKSISVMNYSLKIIQFGHHTRKPGHVTIFVVSPGFYKTIIKIVESWKRVILGLKIHNENIIWWFYKFIFHDLKLKIYSYEIQPSDSSSMIWLTKLMSSLGLMSIPFKVSTKLLILFQSSVDLDSISKYSWNFPDAPFLVSMWTIFFSFA